MPEKPSNISHWRQLDRRTVYDSKFLKLHVDALALPSGQVIDDYSVVSIPDVVVVVATDQDDKLIFISEYKYAVGQTLLTFPAGGIGKNETPLEAGMRELLEETGYESGQAEYVAPLAIYPSKIEHWTHIIRVRGARKGKAVVHEETESISEPELVPGSQIARLVREKKLKMSIVLAAIAVTYPEFLTE